MFFLSATRQETFDAAYTYPFEETFDEDFKEDLYHMFLRYEHVLPEKFFKEIVQKTLFDNPVLMHEFKAWCNEQVAYFTTMCNTVHEKREAIIERFDVSAREVFQQSLHDGKIKRVEQIGEDIKLMLDMRGGFTVQAMIELVFHEARMEGQLEGSYVYDELVETEDGFGLRVLSSYSYLFVEATLYFKNVSARSLYRPAVYVESRGVETLAQYIAALNPEDRYFIVERAGFVEIAIADIKETEHGVFAGDVKLGDTYEQARERIYCATYEDPYAHFSEPVEREELLAAMFSDNQELQVRAFNTAFACGEDVADIVNEALRRANVDEDSSMYFNIIAHHFYKLGCLADDVKLKWENES